MELETHMTLIKSKPVCVVMVRDPDTQQLVEVEIRKLATGPMVGLDGAYLGQLDEGMVDEGPFSPYDAGELILVPDDEPPITLINAACGDDTCDDAWGDMWNWQVGLCVLGNRALIAAIVVTSPFWYPLSLLGGWARKRNPSKKGTSNVCAS